MDPVTLIAAAVAIGASEGVRETTKKAINDAYAALRNWITTKYGSVAAEVSGLEQEPEEELRRALVAKKLAAAGADDDAELRELAQIFLTLVEDQEPNVPATVGVSLRRASIGGDIEVTDVAVEGGSGVVAEDIVADGSLRIRGVSARVRPGAAPPSQSAGAVVSDAAPAQTFTSAQRNVNVGRDNITNVTIGGVREAGNRGGRIRAVTVSVEPVPVGRNFWAVKVNNGTSGPITDLDVDVYLVDATGLRSEDVCLPAKGHFSLQDLAREVFTETLSGGLGAIGQQAHSMYSGLPQGMSFGGPQFGQLGSYAPMMSSHIVNSPQVSAFLRNAQQQMIDRFPRVVPAGQSAGVVYIARAGEVRADMQFADEVGNLWRRRFGEPPEPVLEDE
jgi:hypothetical protein